MRQRTSSLPLAVLLYFNVFYSIIYAIVIGVLVLEKRNLRYQSQIQQFLIQFVYGTSKSRFIRIDTVISDAIAKVLIQLPKTTSDMGCY